MESVIRVVIVYLFVLFALRLLGKREFGQFSALELVMLMLIPDIVAPGIVREDFSLTTALVAVSTVMLLVVVTSMLAHVSKRAERAVTPMPTVLLFDGNLYSSAMNKERISAEEILQVAHQTGIETLDQVKWAILQSDGRIAIIPKNSEA
ncbi:MAG TPA: YetF domain-containing protein [Trueperaceae bacterium]|nr:YetF domain-containing protein [Trueperaceae bacterium]